MTPPKKRVSAAELCWIVTEKIREIRGFPPALTLAVIGDEIVGWRVVVGKRRKSLMTAERSRQLGQLERKLRQSYALAKE